MKICKKKSAAIGSEEPTKFTGIGFTIWENNDSDKKHVVKQMMVTNVFIIGGSRDLFLFYSIGQW